MDHRYSYTQYLQLLQFQLYDQFPRYCSLTRNYTNRKQCRNNIIFCLVSDILILFFFFAFHCTSSTRKSRYSRGFQEERSRWDISRERLIRGGRHSYTHESDGIFRRGRGGRSLSASGSRLGSALARSVLPRKSPLGTESRHWRRSDEKIAPSRFRDKARSPLCIRPGEYRFRRNCRTSGRTTENE